MSDHRWPKSLGLKISFKASHHACPCHTSHVRAHYAYLQWVMALPCLACLARRTHPRTLWHRLWRDPQQYLWLPAAAAWHAAALEAPPVPEQQGHELPILNQALRCVKQGALDDACHDPVCCTIDLVGLLQKPEKPGLPEVIGTVRATQEGQGERTSQGAPLLSSKKGSASPGGSPKPSRLCSGSPGA